MMDHFSWHENLSYTYPHWLYDLCTYLIYAVGGFKGLYIATCALSVILGVSIFFVNSKLTKNKSISFIVTMGALYMLESYIAARAQLVTFILFIWELLCIEKFIESRKFGYGIALIVISTLIANLHVATWPFFFVLFLPYIAEYLIAVIADVVIYGKINKLLIKINVKKKMRKLKQKEIRKKRILIKLNYQKITMLNF